MIDSLYALTFWRPWPTLVMRTDPERKNCENRTLPPPKHLLGRRVAVHAGKRYGLGTWPFGGMPPADADCPTGIVGTVLLAGVLDMRDPDVPMVQMPGRVTLHRSQSSWNHPEEVLRKKLAVLDQSPWWAGPVGILVEEPISFDPIPVNGAQGWWTVPDEIAAIVREREAR